MNRFLYFALLLCFVTACDPDPEPPVVQEFTVGDFTPQTASPFEHVLLNGTGFGTDTSVVRVSLTGGARAKILSLADDHILLELPANATNGALTVEVAGEVKSTTAQLQILTGGTWERLPDFAGTNRSRGLGGVVGNKIYYGLGNTGSSVLSDWWEFDPANGAWLLKTGYPGNGAYLGVSFVLNDQVFVGLGRTENPGGPSKQLWSYNPATEAWTQRANLPNTSNNTEATAFVLNNQAYVVLSAAGIESSEVWSYDPATDQWAEVPNKVPGANRAYGVGFVLDGAGYYGLGGYSIFKDFWRFSPADNTWTSLPDLPAQGLNLTVFGTAFTIGQDAYVLVDRQLWRLNATSGQWTRVAAPGGVTFAQTSFSLNGKAYLLGGQDQSPFEISFPTVYPGPSRHFWAFTPQ